MYCKNHKNQVANNLCMSCGNFYCDSCMESESVIPICKNCSSAKNGTFIFPSGKIGVLGFVLSGTILLLVSVFISNYFFIPLAIEAIVFLFFMKIFSKPKLTKLQIDKLVELTGNKLTVKKVSDSTGVSEKNVKKYLDKLLYSGDFDTSTNNYDLIYYKTNSFLDNKTLLDDKES